MTGFVPTHTIGGVPVVHVRGSKFLQEDGHATYVRKGSKATRIAQIGAEKREGLSTSPIVVNANTHQLPWNIFGLACQAMDPHGSGMAHDWQGNTADRITVTRVRVSVNKGNMEETRLYGQDQFEFEMPSFVSIEGEKIG